VLPPCFWLGCIYAESPNRQLVGIGNSGQPVNLTDHLLPAISAQRGISCSIFAIRKRISEDHDQAYYRVHCAEESGAHGLKDRN
jgi:hypothetical protein